KEDRIVHAVARALADDVDAVLAIELEGDLLYRRHPRHRRQRDAEVALAQVLPVEPSERLRLAQLDETRRAPDAEDVDEIGERVALAGAEVGRPPRGSRHPAREPPPLCLADAGAVPRGAVRRAPAALGVQAREGIGQKLLFACLSRPAPAGTGTVTAAHDSKT